MVLTHDAYASRNEHLMATLLGAAVHHLTSSADLSPRDVGYYRAFQSDWELDLGAHEARLRDLLVRLG